LKSVDEFAGHGLDYVITVCDYARGSRPVFRGGTQRRHWPFDDPGGVEETRDRREAAFRRIRDQSRVRTAVEIDSGRLRRA
jgi:arsenate reductase